MRSQSSTQILWVFLYLIRLNFEIFWHIFDQTVENRFYEQITSEEPTSELPEPAIRRDCIHPTEAIG